MIGILGEDETDCRTLGVLVRRIVEEAGGRQIGVRSKYPPTGGCAALRRKATAYLAELGRAGCSAAIVLHDLDRDRATLTLNPEPELRAKLEAIDVPASLQRHICIPIEELEAWFWSDQVVLDLIGNGLGKASLHPHTISSPKEALTRLSRKAHVKAAYSTNQNEMLAKKLTLERCAERCPSFRDLQTFVCSVAAS